jgi:AcrR family transcriptional regulator
MKASERREKDRDLVRMRLLDAAREVFIEHGYEGATMRRIADRAGYTTGALVHHFKDKESLLLALCELDFLALGREFERLKQIRDPLERLREIGRVYCEFALRNPNHYRLMFMTSHPHHDPAELHIERGNPDQDAYAFLRTAVAEAIAAGRFRPECSDPDLVAQVLWSGVHGIVALHMTHACDPWPNWRPVEQRAELLIEALLRGLIVTEG